MEIALFRARVRPDAHLEDYDRTFGELMEIVSQMPGFISIEGFTHEDGELAVVQFESDKAMKAWYEHPTHQAAQQRGREEFYTDYEIIIATIHRRRTWNADT